MLSKGISDNQKDWDVHLPKALFAYRTSLHESTGFFHFMSTMDTLPHCLLMSCFKEYHHFRREQKKYLHIYVQEVVFFHLKQHTITFAKALRKPTKPTSLDTIKRSLGVALLWVI